MHVNSYLFSSTYYYIYVYIHRNDKNTMRLYPAQNGPIIVTLNLFYLQWSENSKKKELTIQCTFPSLSSLFTI